MKQEGKKSITLIPLILIAIPTVLLSALFSVVAPRNVYLGNVQANETALRNACSVAIGEYAEHGFNDDFKNHIVSYHEDMGIDFSVFSGQDEIYTTIAWPDGTTDKPAIAEEIIETVLNQKKDYFSINIFFHENSYYGYYMPILDDSGNAIGMMFTAKTTEDVVSQVRGIIILIVSASWGTTIIIGIISIIVMRRMKKDLRSAISYLGAISSGSLYSEIDEKVLNRPDEIGDVGKSAKALKESLESLINYDSLTGLLNRRSCLEVIKKIEEDDPTNFFVALGDLDSFKAINDTYGHTAGDKVLIEVSKAFKDVMGCKGYVSRWGGEEFLFVFENAQESKVQDILNEIIARVRIIKFETEGKDYNVTISIGLSQYVDSIDKLITKADKNMYKAKEKGGNVLIK